MDVAANLTKKSTNTLLRNGELSCVDYKLQHHSHTLFTVWNHSALLPLTSQTISELNAGQLQTGDQF